MFVEYRYVILNNPSARRVLASLCCDAHVIELGPGKWGGLAREALASPAQSYLGVDTEPVLVAPRSARYVRADAHTVFTSARAWDASISTGFFDPRINEDLDAIVFALAERAPQGLHWIAPEAVGCFEDHRFVLTPIAPDLYRTQRIRTAS
ncbi:MAG: hypothetical protein ACMXYM_01370 [Candidatus Woesearchaeota archaeon]